jgi:antitoxin (DNA-binding transcriptional repressor) of toxin-antitoxin stability system
MEATVPARPEDLVSIEDAQLRLSELADHVVAGAEKILTKDGLPYVAMIDARKLDYLHSLEVEHRGMVLLDDAARGLKDAIIDSRKLTEEQFRKSLGRRSPT